ncbi:MAG: hypothetical protein EYC70_12295 [Planctomycetota bacterium]|nr:MAG: hypothetical protein EYC70_12295 [Planctomycetota bacterium]
MRRNPTIHSGTLPSWTIVLAAGAALGLAGCGGGGGGGGSGGAGAAPSISVTQPAAPISLVKGETFLVELTATDPDSVARISVYADEDGNLNTTFDQVRLRQLDEQNGSVLSFEAGSARLYEATFMIVGEVDDDRHAPVRSTAPGTVAVDNVSYAVRAGGVVEDSLSAIAEYDDAACVVTGNFRGTAIFGSGEPNETSLASGGEDDISVARFNPDGMLAWAKRAGGPGFDKGLAVASFADGSSVAGGFFEKNATFGAGEPGVTDLISLGGADIFLARYNDDGTLAWATSAGGPSFEQILHVVTSATGTIYATGEFSDSCTFGIGEPNETTLVSQGQLDMFVAVYNSGGTLSGVRHVGGTGDQSGRDISTYPDGSFLVTGGMAGTATFGLGEPNETTLISDGDGDIFYARYNPDGTLAWAKRAGGLGVDAGLGVARLTDDSFALVGTFNGMATFGVGEPNETVLTSAGAAADIFYGRFNSDGTLIWVSRVGDTLGDVARDVAAFDDGSFVITGTFRGTVVFGEGTPDEVSFSADGANDSFVAHLTADNALAWAARSGGTGKDGAFGAVVYFDNSVGLAGRFNSPATFGRGDENETTLTSAGDRDLFVARYNPYGGF